LAPVGLSWIAQDPQAIVWIVNPDAYLLKTSVDKVSLFFETYQNFRLSAHCLHYKKVWFAGGCFIHETGTIMAQKK